MRRFHYICDARNEGEDWVLNSACDFCKRGLKGHSVAAVANVYLYHHNHKHLHKKMIAIGGAATAAERRILDVHMSLCPHMSVHK